MIRILVARDECAGNSIRFSAHAFVRQKLVRFIGIRLDLKTPARTPIGAPHQRNDFGNAKHSFMCSCQPDSLASYRMPTRFNGVDAWTVPEKRTSGIPRCAVLERQKTPHAENLPFCIDSITLVVYLATTCVIERKTDGEIKTHPETAGQRVGNT